MLWAILTAGVIVYGTAVLAMFLMQKRMVYRPTAEMATTPGAAGLPFESVTLTTDDGMRLSAWFVPVQNARGAVLFCHGNGGNMSHRIETLRQFADLGLDAFIFDYRGYGGSEGAPDEEGTYRDAAAAWRHLIETRGLPPERSVIAGRSLGGAIAAQLAAEQAPAALVIDSAFASIAAMGRRQYPWLPVRLLSRIEYDARAHVRRVRCPVLVLHSTDDELIPIEDGRAVWEAAPHPKQFVALRGAHGQAHVVDADRYIGALDAFLSQHLASRRQPADGRG
jgi:fermentation-respiration switch protein FrsA (DUF1100 family)